MSENNQPEPAEQSLLDNLWTSLELALATRTSASLSASKVSFLLRMCQVGGLTETSSYEEARRVFEREVKRRGWKLGELMVGAGEPAFRRLAVLRPARRQKKGAKNVG